jgi:hypothetical protein
MFGTPEILMVCIGAAVIFMEGLVLVPPVVAMGINVL